MDNQPPLVTSPSEVNGSQPPKAVVSNSTLPTPTPSTNFLQPSLTNSNSAPQQPINSSSIDSSSPNTEVIYGHNTSYKGVSSNHKILWLMLSVVMFLVLVAAVLYIWFLPTQWANTYQKTVKPLYQQQATQMTAVYQSVSRPVFASSNSSSTSDTQDLTYIKGVLQTATDSTSALKTKDHLVVLPGTTWLHSVSQANAEHQAMQQYISDSQAFLTNYQTLATYIEGIIKVGKVQLPQMINDFNKIGASAGNRSTLLAATQTTTTDLQNFTNQVKSLTPSTDLKQFNDSLATDLNGMRDGLQGLTVALQGSPTSNILNSVAEFQTATVNLGKLLTTNPTANLLTSSSIHDQITSLEAEHPIP